MTGIDLGGGSGRAVTMLVLAASLLATAPMAIAPEASETSLQFRMWPSREPVCAPVPLVCPPPPLVDSYVAWELRACSDRLAVLEVVIVTSTLGGDAKVLTLNGPPGLPTSVGPCYSTQGSSASLGETCGAGVATLTPAGGGPIVAFQVTCGGNVGPVHHNFDVDFHQLP